MSNTRLPKLAQFAQNQPRLSRRKLYAAMLIASQWMAAGQLWAAPEGGEVVGGEGIIEQSGVDTLIHQATERLAIDWKSFDVAANERVEFIQPSSSSIALNRVLSNNGTQILGRIDSNGQVMVVNPNGVVFGKDSIINVGGMIASGMSIDPASFINGDFTLSSLEGTEGKVINYGIINAATGGSVTLVGQQVQNDGLISAKLGAVNLAAGNEAVLTFDQSGLVGVKVTEAVLQNELGVDAAVINSGAINAEGGRVLLSASVSEDIFSNAVNNAGMNKASSAVVHDDGSFTLGAGADVINTGDIDTSVATGAAGQVVVVGNNITSSGTIVANTGSGTAGAIELHSTDTTLVTETGNVSAQAATKGEGGDIKILGNKVGLFDNAEVNASGANGGGQVLIGGDKTGANKHVRNADFIYLGENSAVKTDALIDGNGGKLITFASDTARIYGNLYSRGGIEGGNGGFIETSGLKGFEILNTPDITAVAGTGGTWLIDPYNIGISGGNQSNINTADKTFTSSGTATLNINTLRTALENDSIVIVQTGNGGAGDGNITLSAALNFNFSTNATLRLLAHNDIILNNNVQRENNNVTGTLNLELIANKDNVGGGVVGGANGGNIDIANNVTIATNGGYFYAGKSAQETNDARLGSDYTNKVFNFTSAGTISTYGDLGGGDIVINATNDVSLEALAFGYDYLEANSYSSDPITSALVRVGSVTVSAGRDVTLNSDIDFNNTGKRQGGGNNGYTGNTLDNEDTFLKIEAYRNITVDGLISDAGYGDARDALNVELTAGKNNSNNEGALTINDDIYTAGGNFTASAYTFTSSGQLINTDRANSNTGNTTVDGNGNGVQNGNAQWSNGGDVTINAESTVSLGSIITDAQATSGTRRGNLVIQGVNRDTNGISTNNVTVNQNGILNIAGTSTFNTGTGTGGNIDLSNAGNIFNGNLLFASANNVALTDSTAVNFGQSTITGNLTLTSGGNVTQGGDLVVGGTTNLIIAAAAPAANKTINLSTHANDFGGLVTVANTSNLSLRDIDDLTLDAVTTVVGSTGNIELTSTGITSFIFLNGDLNSTAGTAKNITLNGSVMLPANRVINAGTGDITFNGTVNSSDTNARNLTLTGRDITFTNTVGGAAALGTFTITSTGAVNFRNTNPTPVVQNISAAAFSVTASTSFTSRDITTSGVDGVAITSANSINVNSINTSAATPGSIALTANGTGTTKSITVNGDLNANNTVAGQSTVQLTLANTAAAGSINLNSNSYFSSNISVTGSGVADTLKALNTDNTWVTTAANAGTITKTDNTTPKTITFTGFENITGGSAVDTFNLGHNITTSVNGGLGADIFNISVVSLDAAVNGGDGADIFNIDAATTKLTLNGDAGADTFNVNNTGSVTAVLSGGGDGDTLNAGNRANTWVLGAAESLNSTLMFSGIENINGNSGKDTFSIGTRTVSGTIDADGAPGATNNPDDEVMVATDGTINFSSGNSSFSAVQNVEVLRSTGGGKLKVESDVGDQIDWTFAINNTVAKGANSVRFLDFTSYEGGAGNDIFSIQTATPFVGVVDGAGGDNNRFDMSSLALVTTNSIAVGNQHLMGSFATLANIQDIRGNDSTSLRLTSGTNAWNITAKNTGEVGTIDFTGISSIIGASESDSLRTSFSDDVDWSISGTNKGTLTAHSSPEQLIAFDNLGNLDGSGFNDKFSFLVGSSIVSAEGGGGTDTADFSALAARTITIGTATGFAFSGVERLQADPTKEFVLTTSSGATWEIDSSVIGTDGTIGNIEFVGFKTLRGSTGNDTFNLKTNFGGIINAGDGNDTFQIRSAYTGNLQGGNGADTFAFFDGGSIATGGIANAGSDDLAIDRVDLGGLLAGVTVNVSGAAVYGVANIERVTADSAKTFILAAGNISNIWTIEAVNGIEGKLNQLEFAGFNNLQGGNLDDIFTIKTNFTGTINGNSGVDTFTIDTAVTGSILGGDGVDTFIFTNAGSVAPTLGNMADGGGGADVVNLSGITTDKTIALNGSAIYGLTGVERVIGNADRNFTLDASATTTALDWLIDDIDGAGSLDGVNDGRVAGIEFVNFRTLSSGSGADSFTFNHDFTGTVQGSGGNDIFFINNAITGSLQGGNDADRFVFSAAGSIANGGSANAGAGADSVDLSTIAADTTVLLTGGNTLYGVSAVERIIGSNLHTFTLSTNLFGTTWEIYDFDGDETLSDGINDGKVAGIDFVDFKRLQGGNGTDTFNLLANYAGTIDGAGGDDTFNVRTTITGTLLGGNGRDTYVFFDGGSISSAGNSNAGTDGNKDRADFSNLADGSTVTVSDSSIGNIADIEQIIGSATKQFTLAASATNTNVWKITNIDSGNTFADGMNDGLVNGIQFIDFKRLLGGSGTDTFTFEGTTSAIESIDGGLGANTLQGRDALNTWLVSATNMGTVSVNGSPYVVFNRIQNLTGGTLADEFQINAAIRDVLGGTGNDRFIFSSVDNAGAVNFINGQDGDDELSGRRTDNTWSTTGANAGTLGVTGGNLYVTNFSGVERWVGGVGADVFSLNHEISNGISAGDGDNRFNVNTSVGDLEGGAGNDQFVFGAAGDARSVNGGGGTENSLTARNASNTWTITSANAGKIASISNDYVDSFSNIQILNGGTQADTFTINASVGNIFGHAGEDTFSFATNNNGIAALIDGGADSDTLRGRTQDSTWTMTAANAGHVATANTAYVAAFNAVETLSGAANADTLAAVNQANNWAIDGENRGLLRAATTGAAAIAFDGMENLLGNQGVDTFTFAVNGNLTGLLDGGTTDSKNLNTDIVNLSLKTGGVTVQLGRESSNALNIVNVEGIVAAKDVNNNLIGASDTDYQWSITADDQGIVETLVNPLLETSTRFTYFNNVAGGSESDYFKVVSGRITNRIDGGGGNGTDFIDYSERAGHFEIELGGNNGIDTTGVFGIEGIRGNSASGLGTSTIKVNGGDNDWQIGSPVGSAADGINDGSFTPLGGSKVTFENFTNLNSGSGRDTFTYLANGQWIGAIDGGGGSAINTADASSSTVSHQFHVNGTQSGVTNLLNIGVLRGNSATDSRLVSTSSANVWNVDSQGNGRLNNNALLFSGIANLRGGNFRDIFDIANTAAFTGVIDGGGSTEDQLNLSGLSGNVSVALGANPAANLRVTGIATINANPAADNTFIADSAKDNDWVVTGRNSGTVTGNAVAGANSNSAVTFSGFANLAGGDNADKFNFVNNMSDITGWIDAGAGDDSLDLRGTDRNIAVRLTSTKPVGSGGAIAVNNFESIVAAANRDNRLIANNAENTWTIDTTNGGQLRDNLSTVTTAFTNFKHLVGGDQNDNFVFASIGTITGLVDGGGGRDTVDVSKSADANIQITAASANSGYSNIEKYVGNNTTSTITGDNTINNWVVSNNSGTINGTVEFEQFANLIGGNDRDDFALTNATLSDSIDGAGGSDTFRLAGSNIAGEILGGAGDDEFIVSIVDGFAATANIVGGDGGDKLTVSGGTANYKAIHHQGVLEYENPTNVTYTVNYGGIEELFDNAVSESLTIFGTLGDDVFRMQNNKYWLMPTVTINYQQKQNLILNGSSGDQVIVDGNVVIPKTLIVNNASIISENMGRLSAQRLELVATQGVGSQSSRVQLAVDDLALKATNGNIYISEQDSLNIQEFITSATSVFDVTLGGDLLSSANINYTGQFNANSMRGGITLNNENALTGNVNLRAAGDITIKNQTSLNLSDVAAQNLFVDVDGVVTGLGPIVVNGLARFAASSNISLMNAENDFNVLSVSKANNVSVSDKNSVALAGVLTSGAVTLGANGAVNIGASCVTNCVENGGVRAASLSVDAGTGSITVGKNIVANESITFKSAGITVNDAITSGRMNLNAGSGILLLNESGNLNGGSGGSIDLAGGRVEQRAMIVNNGDINVSATDDIQMAESALTESSGGNVSYTGKNIALAGIKALEGTVALKAEGAITDNNGAATNIYANRWEADAKAGIGSGRPGFSGHDAIETEVKVLSVRNAGKPVNDSKINILNSGSLVIEQLRNNGDISIGNLTGDFILDNTRNEIFNINDPDATTQGGVINAGTNGGILELSIPNGVVRAENKASKSNPDIIADIASFVYPNGTRGSFGDINRKIVMHIPSVYRQTARTSAVIWYLKKPVDIVDSSTPIKSLVSNDQLIQIEELSEINPAIFTSVSNYVHDEVAILMPIDQRFDDDEYAQ